MRVAKASGVSHPSTTIRQGGDDNDVVCGRRAGDSHPGPESQAQVARGIWLALRGNTLEANQ